MVSFFIILIFSFMCLFDLFLLRSYQIEHNHHRYDLLVRMISHLHITLEMFLNNCRTFCFYSLIRIYLLLCILVTKLIWYYRNFSKFLHKVKCKKFCTSFWPICKYFRYNFKMLWFYLFNPPKDKKRFTSRFLKYKL
jgi:hypothetical protein